MRQSPQRNQNTNLNTSHWYKPNCPKGRLCPNVVLDKITGRIIKKKTSCTYIHYNNHQCKGNKYVCYDCDDQKPDCPFYHQQDFIQKQGRRVLISELSINSTSIPTNSNNNVNQNNRNNIQNNHPIIPSPSVNQISNRIQQNSNNSIQNQSRSNMHFQSMNNQQQERRQIHRLSNVNVEIRGCRTHRPRQTSNISISRYECSCQKYNKTLQQINKKYPRLSSILLQTFIQFITDNTETIKLQISSAKNKLNIKSKYSFQSNNISNNSPKIQLYSVQAIQQAAFDSFTQTITNFSYMPHHQRGRNRKNKNQSFNNFSLIHKNKFLHQITGPQRTIKMFFQHFLQYIQSYFTNNKTLFIKQNNNKSFVLEEKFQILQQFYYPIIIKEIISKNKKLQSPIYIGGLRNTCMRFFVKILYLFLKNEGYLKKNIKQKYNKAKKTLFFGITDSIIQKYLENKIKQIQNKLLKPMFDQNGNKNNQKRRPWDQQIVKQQAKQKLNSQMMIRTNYLIDQLILGEKKGFLTQESIKQYIELKVHQKIYSDYNQPLQIKKNQIFPIKTIIKGQIKINQSQHRMTERQAYDQLNKVFQQYLSNSSKFYPNQLVDNLKIKITDKVYVYLLSDGKYIMEASFFNSSKIKDLIDKINSNAKLKDLNQTKKFYYVKGNTGQQCHNLSKICLEQFFKHKVLSFSDQSQYFVYCNKRFGFYGAQSKDNFKVHIHRKNGLIQFINSPNKQACLNYLQRIIEVIKKSNQKTLKANNHVPQYFLVSLKPGASIQNNSNQSNIYKLTQKALRQTKYKKENLSILTWNLQKRDNKEQQSFRLAKKQRLKNIIKDLKSKKADIVCLQQASDFIRHIQHELSQQCQLYYMPSSADIKLISKETVIISRFPLKFFTIDVGCRETACVQFEIQPYVQIQPIKENQSSNSNQTNNNRQQMNLQPITMNRTTSKDQQQQIIKKRKKSILIMSIHLKATILDSQQQLKHTKQRSQELKFLIQFTKHNINKPNQTGKYDMIIMAGDWNIPDSKYQNQQLNVQLDKQHNYLKQLIDLQQHYHSQTVECMRTFLNKKKMVNGRYQIGGQRFDRILVKLRKDLQINTIIPKLSQLSLVGDYSIPKNQNDFDVHYDKITRSPSDHFGLYTQIQFKP